MRTSTIRTNRQRRALQALIDCGERGVSSCDMRGLVGALNVPKLMAGLTRNGWSWCCERVEVSDRDGQKCRPGIYHLTPEHKKIAAGLFSGHRQAVNLGGGNEI
jgi:hypothetical protein